MIFLSVKNFNSIKWVIYLKKNSQKSWFFSKKLNNKSEDESYKNQIEEFKTSIKFFIQIYLQNLKKNNSYLKGHWIEDDFSVCEKF